MVLGSMHQDLGRALAAEREQDVTHLLALRGAARQTADGRLEPRARPIRAALRLAGAIRS